LCWICFKDTSKHDKDINETGWKAYRKLETVKNAQSWYEKNKIKDQG